MYVFKIYFAELRKFTWQNYNELHKLQFTKTIYVYFIVCTNNTITSRKTYSPFRPP